MKNRKINFIKLGILLFGDSIILWNCADEQFVENKVKTSPIQINAKTVSFKGAITHFNSKKEKITQKRAYAKSTENALDVTPDWNTLEHNKIAYTNAELTTANSKINRNGEYSSQLYFINVNNNLKNVIFTIWKDKVDQNENIINGRIYFNDLEGKFIDGYRIENGVFTKRFVIKTSIQKASFLPLFLFQDLQDSDESGGGGGCWNTDNLPSNGLLNEVTIHSHNPNWHFNQGPGLGGGNTGYNYQQYVNNATNGFSTNGSSSSLSSGQVTSAAAAILMVAPIEPDENGNCPDGYTKNTTTGKCDYDGSNTFHFDENLVIYEEGLKPIDEFDNKCDGVQEIWSLSQNSGNEYAAVLTMDGAILITQKLNPNGGGISGIYEFNGITYYQYPVSQGAPVRTYSGQLQSAGRYFIPIRATIHSHTPCINDGTDGITNNSIDDDQNFASHYPNVNHYILGCESIGQFNGNSNNAFNIKNGALNTLCNNIN